MAPSLQPPPKNAREVGLWGAPDALRVDRMAELLKIARLRNMDLGLAGDEIAVYVAIEISAAAALELRDETFETNAHDLVAAVRSSTTIDGTPMGSGEAAMGASARRLLAKYDHAPDAEPRAVELAPGQAKLFDYYGVQESS